MSAERVNALVEGSTVREHRMHCLSCDWRWVAFGVRPVRCPYCGEAT